jgi:phosphoribosyl-ATP pyrophosphohydrolase
MDAGRGSLTGGKVCAKKDGRGGSRVHKKDGGFVDEKIKTIINAIEELQLECMHIKSAADKLYWVDYFLDSSRMSLRRALRELERKNENHNT